MSGSDPLEVDPATCSRELFRNKRLAVADFVLPAGHTCTIVHPKTTVRMQAGAGQHALTFDGKDADTHVRDKQVFFVEAGERWRLANLGDGGYRQIVFEFQEPGPKHTEAEIEAMLKAAVYPTTVGTALLLDNPWCRVWDFSLAPGEENETHQHVMDYAFLYVGKGHTHKLIGLHPDGTVAFEDEAEEGHVQWNTIPNGGFLPDGTVDKRARHGGRNGNEFPFTEYLVELK
jgi:hypothetical protein